MIIVNTTFYVEASLEKEFVSWVKNTYIPGSALTRPSVAKILGVVEEGMTAFAVRMYAPTIAAAEAWDNGQGALLRGMLAGKYGQRILHFTTMMENIAL